MNNFHYVPACLPYTTEELEHFIVTWQSQVERIHIDCVRNISPEIKNTISLTEIIEVLSPYEFSFKYIEFHVMGDPLFKNECNTMYTEFYNAVIFSTQDESGIGKELHNPFNIETSPHDVVCMMINSIGEQGQHFEQVYLGNFVNFIKNTTIKNIHIDGGINEQSILLIKEHLMQAEISDKEIFFILGSYVKDDGIKKLKELL